jgi:hypothetical protein
MNTEALFLFLILLLGLVLCSFLGGKCNKESFTGSFNGKFSVQPDSQMNNSSNNNSSNTSNSAAGNNNTSNNYDNYNHYSGTSSQLTNGATFYGENGGSVQVNMQSNGSPTLKVTLSKGQQPITFTTSQSNSSMMNPLTSIFGNSSSSSTTENYTNFNSSKSQSVNLQFYGPNGETALVINYHGQKAIQVNTNRGSYIYTMNNPASSNQSASNPFNSNYTHYNNTPSTYYGSTGVTGANVNNSNLAYNNSSSASSSTAMPSSQTQTQSSSSYDYSNSLPPGIPKRMIPPGHEDLYILKSEIVPPVCPACPASAACPRQEPCPPCPACARCPEPAFECKKVPNYNSINNDYLPAPVVNDFSSFGM